MLVVLLAGVLLTGAALLGLRAVETWLVVRERCTATVGEDSVTLSVEQAANAATIAGVGLREGVGERGITIALATALQESKLRNLDYGDRDSLGLFQQRPSQGWGSPTQVRDPVYASERFYRALRQVPSYAVMPVAEAAQAVQRSAAGSAYQQHEARAALLAAALSGRARASLSCGVRPPAVEPERPGPSGLTPRAAGVRDEVERVFGEQRVGGFAPGGVSSGHMEGSAHYNGRAVDVFFRPVGDERQRRRGWALASWLVASAERLGIATVIYDDRIWTARRSAEGWRPYAPPGGPTEDPVRRHLDHVHVDVLDGR